MMKHEFEELIGNSVTESDWEIVHTVYQWYPEIDDVEGKTQVAWLWKNFGKRVFVDMLPRATEALLAELEIQRLSREIEEVRQALKKL